MLKKSVIKSSIFSIFLAVTLLFNTSFAFAAANTTNLGTTDPGGGGYSGKITRAVIVHDVGVPRYGEKDVYYYVQPKEAIQIANNLAYSPQRTFAMNIIGLFGTTVPAAALLTGVSWFFQNENASEIGKIKDLAVSGPVMIMVSTTPYGTYISSEKCDSNVSSLNFNHHDYYDSLGNHYFDTVSYYKIQP